MHELQNVILEMVAKGDPLADTADHLCTLVERLVPGVICSILRVDQEAKLRPLASPSLPLSFSKAIDGLDIGPNVGSCGSAAFSGSPVIVEDIESDPKWANFKGLAIPLGLRACWSTPVIGLAGRVIGTFAFYFKVPRRPTSQELELVEVCVHLCSIALERHERVLDRERKAYSDTLTHLNNRASFVADLAKLSCDQDPWALLLVDVDNLKIVNDTFGHQSGDDLLRVTGKMLAAVALPHIAYRIGGDEFAVIIKGEDGVSNLDNIAEGVLQRLEAPAVCDGRSIVPTATIGFAVVAIGDQDPDAVRRNADFALYHAKENKRGGFVRYTPQLSSTMIKRANAIRDVALALEEGRIDAYYQPVVRLDSRAIVGVEALCRLITPEGEVVPAAAFHEATSDARVASELTRRMMAIAASDVRKWLDMGIPFQHVGINISSSDFHGGNLEKNLCETFKHEGVSLNHIVLEVTESVYLHRHDQVAKRVIESIRSKGVVVALDDFGTGFASLTDLLNVPIDVLKIDRSFVDRLPRGEASAVIIEALISIARKLGMQVIAEGVEAEEQATQLGQFGCTLAQGYLFSKAVHRDEITVLLLRSAQPLSDILRTATKNASSNLSAWPVSTRVPH